MIIGNKYIVYLEIQLFAIILNIFAIEVKNGFIGNYNGKSELVWNRHNEDSVDNKIFNLIRNDSGEELISPIVIAGNFSRNYTYEINRTTEYIFDYHYDNTILNRRALRITMNCPSSNYSNPLLVVVRQQKEIMSWQLPLEPPPNTFTNEEYKRISRTLCPPDYKNRFSHPQRLSVDITTSSYIPLIFSLEIEILNEFIIQLMSPRNITVSPGESVYYYFQFPEEINMVLVKATSDDDICAILSIQNSSCPIFDTEETAKYGKFYQTMTLQAGITVRKANYPNGFYIIMVALSNDEECSTEFQHIYRHRVKNVMLLVEEKMTFSEYLAAIIAGIAFCLFFYVVALVLFCIEYMR